ncbi:MAG: hypothetical protein ACR2M5_16945 [Nakamurella sp.]
MTTPGRRPGSVSYVLRFGVCASALAAADRCAAVELDERNVRLAAEAAALPVWSRVPVCANALAAADRCAAVELDERSTRLADEAALAPVCLVLRP